MFAGCQPKSSSVDYAVNPYNREVVVDQVLQASSYTYLLVGENKKQFWIAVTRNDAKQGATYFFSEAMEMKNFHSKDLDRTFESILFVGDLSDKPIPAVMQAIEKTPHGEKPVIVKQDVKVEPVEGCITIAEIFANREKYNGQTVKVVGQVSKFNPNIMKRNWVHIQDGTGTDEFFDLTITTQENVTIGDVVLFEGKLALAKDFGSGYFYDLIIEDATAVQLSLL
ncbi:MAG: hypothetical protein CVT92_04155 [Bacteroidetes bacterium HGW-Bacteroidetes-1]|jgi:hypothetical protein|nr:MAG: hypothetical protein CVT92_04155 [Bacteroidetes bacterium HGW-Bacteroidetes-1]